MSMSAADISAGYHINHSLWGFGMTAVCGTGTMSWIEIGYTLGFHGASGYHVYTADQNLSGVYDDAIYSNVSADSSSHTYEVKGNPGDWVANIDGNPADSVAANMASHICESQTGLETSASAFNKSTTSTATFAATDLKWQDTNGNWHTGWSTAQFWADHPCGSGYSPPNCYNGIFYGASEWSSNKPS